MVLPDSVAKVKHGMPCARLLIHCPFSPLVNPSRTDRCSHSDLLQYWACIACEGSNFIDGEGYLHCNCAARYHFWSTTFICTDGDRTRADKYNANDALKMIVLM